jgi:Coenzyme PQQ synthesis protein D (PqqD)
MRMEDSIRPLRRSDLTVREAEGETLVLDRVAGKIHQLNETASYVWGCCDGSSTVMEIATRYANEYSIAHKLAHEDVIAVVSGFQSSGLLFNSDMTRDDIEEN